MSADEKGVFEPLPVSYVRFQSLAAAIPSRVCDVSIEKRADNFVLTLLGDHGESISLPITEQAVAKLRDHPR
jgi:hypothetical protein